MIPVNEPFLGDKERVNLLKCIEDRWISAGGPFVEELEEKFSAYIGAGRGIAVCNGTAAIETALYAAGISKGDRVILPSFTIISCAIAVLRRGAVPVLVDSHPDTWNMNVSRIESRITSRSKAIMPVHIYGGCVDMDPLLELACKYDLRVIEDAAEAHGVEYRGKKCGSMGDISAFSFYANKIISTGEGGMVLTSSEKMAKLAQSYRNLCFLPEQRFLHRDIGYNFRMTNLQAAVGVAQLEQIETFLEIKRRNGQLYDSLLGSVDGLAIQHHPDYCRSNYWMYGILLDDALGIDALAFGRRLRERGVDSRPFFLGMHQQPCFQKLGLFRGESYPVTEKLSRLGLYLPSGLTLTENQIHIVCEAVKDALVRL
ncbi:DegT/DnrJ/EryC1/StrS family aminotransferase [bacterium]|nr:DegT/DnrJ/EryC1/StrS family aminotransferase [bacterium]